MENTGSLTVRMKANWDFNTRYADLAPYEMVKRFDSAEKRGSKSTLINPDGVKIYVDGVPIGYNSPYVDPCPNTHGNHGKANISPAALSKAVVKLDKLGLSIMVHVVGDAATRSAINAVADARRINGKDGPRHHLTHTISVNKDDIGRGHDLNISFDISPNNVFSPGSFIKSFEKYIGRRNTQLSSQLKSMLDAGDTVAYGSDWDNVAEPDPWYALEAMITRMNPGDPMSGKLAGHQAISLQRALEVITYNGAFAIGLEHEIGSLEVGKSADMIILDQNLFKIPVTDIHKTKVLETILMGKTVYKK